MLQNYSPEGFTYTLEHSPMQPLSNHVSRGDLSNKVLMNNTIEVDEVQSLHRQQSTHKQPPPNEYLVQANKIQKPQIVNLTKKKIKNKVAIKNQH